MIDRARDAARLREALARSPAVLLVGPRQAGKSTLAASVVPGPAANRFDLEDPRDLARLGEPILNLAPLAGTVVIEEAQRVPGLFPVLRLLIDQDRRPGRFLVLGSASPDLVGLAAESLAGRVTVLELGGLRAADVGPDATDRLWCQGALPLAFTLPAEQSERWRDDYIATFLERDLAQLGFRVPATTMRRFWTMLAHHHAQTWNGAELSRALGLSQPTVRRYLDALSDALVVRQLHPWHANLSKRQVRAPKVYVRDSGVLHRLLGLDDLASLLGHPKSGASWEGFVIEQLLMRDQPADPAFWATHSGAEIDLLLPFGAKRIGVEVKRTAEPRLTPSIRTALRELQLEHVFVIHAGQHRFALSADVTAVPVTAALVEGLAP